MHISRERRIVSVRVGRVLTVAIFVLFALDLYFNRLHIVVLVPLFSSFESNSRAIVRLITKIIIIVLHIEDNRLLVPLASASFPISLLNLEYLNLFIVPSNAAYIKIDCHSYGSDQQNHHDDDPSNEAAVVLNNFLDYDDFLLLNFWRDEPTCPRPARWVHKGQTNARDTFEIGVPTQSNRPPMTRVIRFE